MATMRLMVVQYLAVLGFLVVALNTRPCESQILSCSLRLYLSYEAQKPGCRPMQITINGCYGRCHTSEIPMLDPPYKMSDHVMCSYGATASRQVQLDDCDPGVDPTFTYQDAVSCVCSRCNSQNTVCMGI